MGSNTQLVLRENLCWSTLSAVVRAGTRVCLRQSGGDMANCSPAGTNSSRARQHTRTPRLQQLQRKAAGKVVIGHSRSNCRLPDGGTTPVPT